MPVVGQVYEYYALGDSPVIRPYPLPYLTDAPAAETFVDDVLQDCDRCWLILAREWFFDPGDRLATALARRGHLRLAETAAGVRVYSWQRATQAEESQQSP